LMFGISTASLLDENMNSAIKAYKDQIQTTQKPTQIKHLNLVMKTPKKT